MAIVKNLNKKTGVTYVYESISYWDPDLKAPRSHRTLIGKIMPGCTEIIPTGKKGGTREKKSVKEKEAAYKARKARKDLEQTQAELEVAEAVLDGEGEEDGKAQKATVDYRSLLEETKKAYEVQLSYKELQLQELKNIATEQEKLLVSVNAQVAELLAKTKKILISLCDDDPSGESGE